MLARKVLHSSKLMAVDFSPWQDVGSSTQFGSRSIVIELDHDALAMLVVSAGVEARDEVAPTVVMLGSDVVAGEEVVLVVADVERLAVDAACEDPRKAVVVVLVVGVSVGVGVVGDCLFTVVSAREVVVGSIVTDSVEGQCDASVVFTKVAVESAAVAVVIADFEDVKVES